MYFIPFSHFAERNCGGGHRLSKILCNRSFEQDKGYCNTTTILFFMIFFWSPIVPLKFVQWGKPSPASLCLWLLFLLGNRFPDCLTQKWECQLSVLALSSLVAGLRLAAGRDPGGWLASSLCFYLPQAAFAPACWLVADSSQVQWWKRRVGKGWGSSYLDSSVWGWFLTPWGGGYLKLSLSLWGDSEVYFRGPYSGDLAP